MNFPISLITIASVICLSSLACAQTDSPRTSDPGSDALRWSPAKAHTWYEARPWVCGFNYVPANAISYTEMFMPDNFDVKRIDLEMAAAAKIGLNAARIVLPFVVWEHDPAAFKARLTTLFEIGDRHGVQFVPALFDDCVFGPISDPAYGPQPAVVPGWYANGWTPSPGHSLVRDAAAWPRLEKYAKDILTTFKDDQRVLLWDLYNEPTNGGIGNVSIGLVDQTFNWAREVSPSQPLTVDTFGSAELRALTLRRSDIITFHNYSDAAKLTAEIHDLKRQGRPVMCTEWLNRNGGSTVASALPLFAAENVGCFNWGLVNGRTQTDLCWGHRPGQPLPAFWQHDLLRADYTPYDPEELRLFSRFIEAARVRKTQRLSSAAGRPNILVILADDLGFSDLSCYGSEIQTPNIDRLAEGGVRFSAFYNSARCCPSRASLLTGLHPHEAGIGSFTTGKPAPGKGPAYTGHLLPEAATLPEMLSNAGYSTWMVGKWHLGNPGPIRRGFQNYYGFKDPLSHSENQWDPAQYERLPKGTKPEFDIPKGEFYATDVFTDYSLEFLKQARQRKDQPWLLYLAHSSPHFPIQAPRADIDKNVATYRKGWDVLRTERFERQKKLGLMPADAVLPPLSEVPVETDAIANGYAGKPNPQWTTLPDDRREDLAWRMATFAAMVQHVDQSVGRIVADLERNHELGNTLIFFMSDNGACYEWGPFGFDGPSRRGTTTCRSGALLNEMGQDGTHSSYGSGWANLSNTPLNMYKHFCHEGGIASPLIVQWPAGFKPRGTWIDTPAHIMDIAPTVCAAVGVRPLKELGGKAVIPFSGSSLLPACRGGDMPDRPIATEHQEARGYRMGDWKIVWGKRQPDPIHWELYNLRTDRSEQHDVSSEYPEILAKLVAGWTAWAKKVGVYLEDQPASRK